MVGAAVTAALEIPTIGIGAGPSTSGQVLVYHDLLGMTSHPHHAQVTPKFCKQVCAGTCSINYQSFTSTDAAAQLQIMFTYSMLAMLNSFDDPFDCWRSTHKWGLLSRVHCKNFVQRCLRGVSQALNSPHTRSAKQRRRVSWSSLRRTGSRGLRRLSMTNVWKLKRNSISMRICTRGRDVGGHKSKVTWQAAMTNPALKICRRRYMRTKNLSRPYLLAGV